MEAAWTVQARGVKSDGTAKEAVRVTFATNRALQIITAQRRAVIHAIRHATIRVDRVRMDGIGTAEHDLID